MATLERLLETLDELGRDEVIHAAQPWTPDSDAVSLSESAGESVPSGLAYLLEVDLVHDVAEVWGAWRDGRRPTAEQLTEAVIHYAAHDAYLPADGEDSN